MSNRVTKDMLDRALRKFCACMNLPYGDVKRSDNQPGALHFERANESHSSSSGMFLVSSVVNGQVVDAYERGTFGGLKRSAKEWHDMLMTAVMGWEHRERLAQRSYTWDDKKSVWVKIPSKESQSQKPRRTITFHASKGVEHTENGKPCADCAAGLNLKDGTWYRDLRASGAEIIEFTMTDTNVKALVEFQNLDAFCQAFEQKQSFAFAEFFHNIEG